MDREKTVLFIEDDPDQQKMYSFVFKRAGVRFLQAQNGEDGIKIAEREKPDVILLDILMNGIDGVDTLERMKQNPNIPKTTAIIIFTNYTKEDVLKRAENLGAIEIIIKTDVVPSELVERIRKKYLHIIEHGIEAL